MIPESAILPWLPVLLAFSLDLLLGDPSFLPHPVRWMGRAIQIGEPFCRRYGGHPYWGGMILAGALVAGTWLVTLALVVSVRARDPWLGCLLEALLLYYCLASRSLQQAASAVADHLQRGDLPAARRSVGLIVGRETAALNRAGASRAAVETVAENLVDGVVAPLVYAVIGGAPLAMAYKMVNTLDSMIGYQNDRYRDFGRAAARLDDAANWLPARLSVPLVALASGHRPGEARWASSRQPQRGVAGSRFCRCAGGAPGRPQPVSRPCGDQTLDRGRRCSGRTGPYCPGLRSDAPERSDGAPDALGVAIAFHGPLAAVMGGTP